VLSRKWHITAGAYGYWIIRLTGDIKTVFFFAFSYVLALLGTDRVSSRKMSLVKRLEMCDAFETISVWIAKSTVEHEFIPP